MKLLLTLTALVAAASAESSVRASVGYAAPAVRVGYAAPAVRVGYAAPAVRAVPLPVARILESSSETDDQGGYAFRFLSDDGISREEQRSDGAVVGSYSYVAPDGSTVSVRYVADTLGFRADGDSLPTPVPTEYPTPVVPSTEVPAEQRTVQLSYSSPQGRQEQEQERAQVQTAYAASGRAAVAPVVRYEPVYELRPVSL